MSERRSISFEGYIMDVVQRRSAGWEAGRYPFALPAVRSWETLELHEDVTFLVGENGSGKSTLIEAIAIAAGFNPEGGSLDHGFATRDTHSKLYSFIRLAKSTKRPKDNYFLRAESFYSHASFLDDEARLDRYGGKSIHSQSHGEGMLALMANRLTGDGLYIFDEPEAALSPQRQLQLLAHLHQLVKANSQFIIATHSPIILSYPNAWIYNLGESGPERRVWSELEHVGLTKQFLNHPQVFLNKLLTD